MNISFLDDEPEIFPLQYGGKARTIMELARNFSKNKEVENVSILSQSINSDKPEFIFEGINFKKLKGHSTIRQILDEASFCGVLNVHTCSFTMPYLTGFDTVIVYHLHDIMFTTANAGSHLDKAMGNNWSGIISPSEFASQTLENICWWNDLKKRIVTIPRGIDFNIFHPVDKKSALKAIAKPYYYNEQNDEHNGEQSYKQNGEENKQLAEKLNRAYPIIFFPHRYCANKGEEFLQNLYDLMVKKYPNTLILATSNNGKEEMNKQEMNKQEINKEDVNKESTNKKKKKNNKTGGIENIKWIKSEELKNYYSISDICIVSSKAPESFSQVPLEAIACGTPVIAFRFGNLSNLIDELPSVKECKPLPEDMYKTISYMLSNTEEVKKEITESQALIKRKYDLNIISNRFLEAYKVMPKNKSTKQPSQINDFANQEPRCFTSPLIAIYKNEIFVPTENNGIEKYCLNKQESEMLTYCKKSAAFSELYKRFGTKTEVDKIVDDLETRRILVRC